MGAGILPVAIHNNELYFLFGKENQFEKSAPGFADFGGGSEPNETYFQTAIREGSEELTGFLGDQKELKRALKQTGMFFIDFKPNNTEKIYRTFILPIEYDDKLVYYFNNNQRFIQKHLDPKVIQNTRIFEKSEIRWFNLKDMEKNKEVFRSFYQNIVNIILGKREAIQKFIDKKGKRTRSKTRKNRYKY
jgi:8-oxo-dGTP pyrophosphatase MutT (NUDIX family)